MNLNEDELTPSELNALEGAVDGDGLPDGPAQAQPQAEQPHQPPILQPLPGGDDR